jgi:hypothetical protein
MRRHAALSLAKALTTASRWCADNNGQQQRPRALTAEEMFRIDEQTQYGAQRDDMAFVAQTMGSLGLALRKRDFVSLAGCTNLNRFIWAEPTTQPKNPPQRTGDKRNVDLQRTRGVRSRNHGDRFLEAKKNKATADGRPLAFLERDRLALDQVAKQFDSLQTFLPDGLYSRVPGPACPPQPDSCAEALSEFVATYCHKFAVVPADEHYPTGVPMPKLQLAELDGVRKAFSELPGGGLLTSVAVELTLFGSSIEIKLHQLHISFAVLKVSTLEHGNWRGDLLGAHPVGIVVVNNTEGDAEEAIKCIVKLRQSLHDSRTPDTPPNLLDNTLLVLYIPYANVYNQIAKTNHDLGAFRGETTKRFDKLEAATKSQKKATKKRFDKVEGRFDTLEEATKNRFDKVEGRFDHLEGRFNTLETQLGKILDKLSIDAAA